MGRMKRSRIRAAAAAAAVTVAVCGCTLLPAPRPTAGPPPTTTAVPTATVDPGTLPSSFGRGTYDVGTDIAPGVYVADPSTTCYWSRSVPDAQERAHDIVEDVFDHPGDGGHRVTLAVGDRFSTSRCGTWEAE